MKTISILGTSSNAGKSWVATALCAWLKRQGVKVAPFKAQNMSNNAYATLENGEIGVAQAIQAEACGLRPIAEMNPILLKPSGKNGSQIVRLGKPGEHLTAKVYYQITDNSWSLVKETLDWWETQCDVLVMEGAGSPVELNLMDRDIVNLKPGQYTDGKWILVSDIECGGVFPQVIGTWNLLPKEDQDRGLGFIVNKFRGDVSLFSEAQEQFAKHTPLPYLGVLPFSETLHLEDEDSLNAVTHIRNPDTPFIAWIHYPHCSNTQDQMPWSQDSGIDNRWVHSPEELMGASAIILPGSKNTLADLRWLKSTGFDQLIIRASNNRIPVIGICGGFQMLGTELVDPLTNESEKGLGLLPTRTIFISDKKITRRTASHENDSWETFEIHTGKTELIAEEVLKHLLLVNNQKDGIVKNNIWGTYQHGLFEAPSIRQRLLDLCRIKTATISQIPWKENRNKVYESMADFIEEHLDLEPLKRYLGI